ncbi:MAG: hypothetical protein IPJ65_21935 [Archangiaceae bacterium]|nr:hypothetical protein [Archangiaceae bacterium]
MTRADLDAARARDASAFSDADALTQYLRAQHAQLASRETALASPPAAGEHEVLSDVAPRRPAIPAAHRAVFEKAGLDDAQMLRAHALGVNPRDLLLLLRKPASSLSDLAVLRPLENTVEQVLTAVKDGVTTGELCAYHLVWVAAADVPAAKAAGFDADSLRPFIESGSTVAQAIAGRAAGLGPEEAGMVSRGRVSTEQLLGAKAAGVDVEALEATLEQQGSKFEDFMKLWARYDHRLVDGSLLEAEELNPRDLMKLDDGKVLDFTRPLDVLDAQLGRFLELEVPVDDMVRVVAAGGSAEGLGTALAAGASLDDYLVLARARVAAELVSLLGRGFSVEQVKAAAITRQPADFFARAAFFHFTPEQALELARAGVDPNDADLRFLARGLSREEAIAALPAGG